MVDGTRLLKPTATLAAHLGLRELVDEQLDSALHRDERSGDKFFTLVAVGAAAAGASQLT